MLGVLLCTNSCLRVAHVSVQLYTCFAAQPTLHRTVQAALLEQRAAVLAQLRTLLEEQTQLVATVTELARHIADVNSDMPPPLPRVATPPAQHDDVPSGSHHSASTSGASAKTTQGCDQAEHMPSAEWEAALGRVHENLTRQREPMLRMHDAMLCEVRDTESSLSADCLSAHVRTASATVAHPTGLCAQRHSYCSLGCRPRSC